jgi:tetratricopeptide (TPR) repeat protein
MKNICLGLIVVMVSACALPAPQPRPDPLHMGEAVRLVYQGTEYLSRNKIAEASAAYELAVKLYPLPEALMGLGSISMKNGDLLQAEQFFKGAAQMNTSDVRPLSFLALVYERQGRITAARDLYEHAIGKNPADIALRRNFIGFLLDNGEREEAAVQRRALAVLNDARVLGAQYQGQSY